jgi:hypothetical protein
MRRSRVTPFVPIVEASSIASDAIPVLVGSADVLTALECALVAHIDGLRSVSEIAVCARAPIAEVRALVFELWWARAVVFDEVMEVDDIDLLDEPARETVVIPLVKRKRRLFDSPLVRAILAMLGD